MPGNTEMFFRSIDLWVGVLYKSQDVSHAFREINEGIMLRCTHGSLAYAESAGNLTDP